jgi:hypothetical protein
MLNSGGALGGVKGATTEPWSGERSERTLDAPKRPRKMIDRSDGAFVSRDLLAIAE